MATMPSLRGTPTNVVVVGPAVTSAAGPAIPPGVVAKDVLVMVVLLETGVAGAQPTVTTPPNYTVLGTRATTSETGGQNSCTVLGWSYDGNSIPTISWDIAAFYDITCFAVQGAQVNATPHKLSGLQSNAAGSFLVPAVTTTIDNCFVVAILTQNWGMNGAPLATWTEIYDDGATAIETNSTVGATAGVLGTYTFTTSTHTNMTMLLAFAPNIGRGFTHLPFRGYRVPVGAALH